MEKTIKHLDFLIGHTQTIMQHFNGVDLPPIQYFALGLYERLHSACTGLKVLVERLEEIPDLEYSAGLVARTTILDFLIALQAYQIAVANHNAGKDGEASRLELQEYCNRALADGLKHLFIYLEDTQVDGMMSKDELNNRYRNIAAQFPAFVSPYAEDGKRPGLIFPPPPTAKGLFKSLLADPVLKPLAYHYDTYAYYSKYEHFGVLSYDLKRVPKADQQKNLAHALELFILYSYVLNVLMASFVDNADFIRLQRDILTEYMMEGILAPTVIKQG